MKRAEFDRVEIREMVPVEDAPAKADTTPAVRRAAVKPADLPKRQPAVPNDPPKPITNSIGMMLVRIEVGTFQMGSTKGAPEEEPPHLVRITRPFLLGKYEVTQEEYEKVTGNNPSKVKGVRNPVDSVSWLDALRFCNMLSSREVLKPFYEIKGELVTVPTGTVQAIVCPRRQNGSTVAVQVGTEHSDSRMGSPWISSPGTPRTQAIDRIRWASKFRTNGVCMTCTETSMKCVGICLNPIINSSTTPSTTRKGPIRGTLESVAVVVSTRIMATFELALAIVS